MNIGIDKKTPLLKGDGFAVYGEDGGILSELPENPKGIPQSASQTAPFRQGGLMRKNMSDIWSLFDKIKKTEKVSGPPEYIIVGLGNPGKDYEKTRHNTGFMALDLISDKLSVHIDRLKFKALTTTAELCGHNGLKSIIACCGGDDFPRIKIGIGKKPEGWDLADWVLGKYSEEDLKTLQGMYENSFEAAKLMVSGKLDEAMNKFN